LECEKVCYDVFHVREKEVTTLFTHGQEDLRHVKGDAESKPENWDLDEKRDKKKE
jgi:hypothetical protein